jgi:signal transduction histidine kinase
MLGDGRSADAAAGISNLLSNAIRYTRVGRR